MTEKLIEILTASKPVEEQPAGEVTETSESAPVVWSAALGRRTSTSCGSFAVDRPCLKLSKGPVITPQLQREYRILRGPPVGGGRKAEQRIASRNKKG